MRSSASQSGSLSSVAPTHPAPAAPSTDAPRSKSLFGGVPVQLETRAESLIAQVVGRRGVRIAPRVEDADATRPAERDARRDHRVAVRICGTRASDRKARDVVAPCRARRRSYVALERRVVVAEPVALEERASAP